MRTAPGGPRLSKRKKSMPNNKCTFNPATREGEHAILARHTAVVGGATSGQPVRFDSAELVRRVRIGKPERYAQYPVSVRVSYTPLGKRIWLSMTAKPDDLTSHLFHDRERERRGPLR
jgi:hypothetical protein